MHRPPGSRRPVGLFAGLRVCWPILSMGVLLPAALARPSFTVGSDPYETIFAYPHDILAWPARAALFSYSPQTLPWQGDVTHVNNRPSETYTSNYQDVEFAPPDGYEGDPSEVRSYASISSYMHRNVFTLGGLATTPYGKVLLELGNASLTMELDAEGVARAEGVGGGEAGYALVPFAGRTDGDRDEYDAKLIFARRAFGHPLGVKIHYTEKSAERPTGYTRFTREGVEYNLSHLTWGWATTGCNHIFGYPHINVDAFYQDAFTVFNGRQWDLQASFERAGNYKSGIRYRTLREDGDRYEWRYRDGSQFEGAYEPDPYWRDRHTDKLLRCYTKARFWERGPLTGGLLLLLQYESEASVRLNKLIEADPDSRQARAGYLLEANPWFNCALPGGFVDGGILLELGRLGLRNSETRWNEVSHTDQEDVLWSTSPYPGWSPYWEDYSHGREWFFATGFEANSSIGVYRGCAVLLRGTVLYKRTDTKKLYGSSEIPEGGHAYRFFRSHRRDDTRGETWMTGLAGISVAWGRSKIYLTQDLPTAYLLHKRTALQDNEERLFEHEQRQMWQVQQPSYTRVFVVHGF